MLWVSFWIADVIAWAATSLSGEHARTAVSDSLLATERLLDVAGPLIGSSVAALSAAMVAVLYARTTRIGVY